MQLHFADARCAPSTLSDMDLVTHVTLQTIPVHRGSWKKSALRREAHDNDKEGLCLDNASVRDFGLRNGCTCITSDRLVAFNSEIHDDKNPDDL
jgi:hypothetical protein